MAMTTRCAGEAWRAARTALDAAGSFGIGQSEKVAVADIMAVRGDGAAICWRAFSAACRRVLSCRCRTAAITAAPSALSPMAAAIHGRCRWARWWPRSGALVERGHVENRAGPVSISRSYGADLPGAPKLGLLRSKSCGMCLILKRLRISSIDQVEVDRISFDRDRE